MFFRRARHLHVPAACACVLADRVLRGAEPCAFAQSSESNHTSANELVSLQHSYKVGALLGEGSFAHVHEAVRSITGEKFALKLVFDAKTSPHQQQFELNVMQAVGQHKNVVGLVEAFRTDVALAMVLDLVSGGEVFERICSRGPYSERDAARLVREVATALEHVHR